MSGLYIRSQQLKSFYSLVDKTFQGELSNGAKLYWDQVTNKSLCDIFLKKYYLKSS